MGIKGKRRTRLRCAVESVEPRLLFSALYVDASASGLTHDGSTWTSALLDLQSALSIAQSGDTIKVADGIYRPTAGTDRTISFVLKNGVALKGGYAGDGAGNPDARDFSAYPTILSGNIGKANFANDNSYHVVVGSGTDSTAVLDGLTIADGIAIGAYADTPNSNGAGMYNIGGSPTVSNCTFEHNGANYYGGGMYNKDSSPAVTNCTFTDNGTREYGGAICNNGNSSPVITNCTFTSNNAPAGSGIGRGIGGAIGNLGASSVTVSGCTFTANGAGTGGAVANEGASASYTDCIFTNNTRSGFGSSGGGMACLSDGDVSILRCQFNGNVTTGKGAGLYASNGSAVIVINSTFVANRLPLFGNSAGGGAYADSGAISLINCSFAANIAGSNAASNLWMPTCVSWGNISLLDPGNDEEDPQFVRNPSPGADGVWGTVDDDFGDLHLRAYSPAVDTGSDDALPAEITTDLSGNPRYVDMPSGPIYATIDRGAYEAIPVLSATAGGPYSVLAGQSIGLRGLGASNASGGLIFSWEWTGNGLFDDGFGKNPGFDSTGKGLGTRTVSLRVTDDLGHSITSTSTLTIVPATLYVDSRATSGNGDGSSWNNAFTSLAHALSVAVPGVLIKVGAGTYLPDPSNRNSSFAMQSGVTIYGGYAGFGQGNPDLRNVGAYPTILSGQIGGAGIADNSLHVVTASGTNATAILDGFTITGGNANGQDFDGYGGGLTNVSGAPNISNCAFTANTAVNGSAIGNINGALNLSNCSISSNSATNKGAVYNSATPSVISNCIFSSNTSTLGGGGLFNEAGSTLTLSGSTFKNNTAQGGGGFYNSGSNATVSNCTFAGNAAGSNGGGGIFGLGGLALSLRNCAFTNNSSAAFAGGLYMAGNLSSCVNCTFVGNTAMTDGGAIFLPDNSPPLVNCTIVGNSAPKRGGGIWVSSLYDWSPPLAVNCIIWGNSASIGAQIYCNNQIQLASPIYSSIVQGGFAGTNVSSADPQFVRSPSSGLDNKWGTSDDDYGDLRLRLSSPGIDAGDNSALPAGVTTDLAGNARLIDVPGFGGVGAIVDIGAYERVAPFADLEFLVDASRPSIRATFNDAALASSITPADLVLVNLTTGLPIDCGTLSTVSYDANAHTATWAFSVLLPDGNYHATLPAGAVLDQGSNPLLNLDTTADFFALAGDANRDRRVDIKDLSILAGNWLGSGKAFSQGDFNYDGVVDAKDLGILSGSWQKTLALPPITLPASTATRSPSRTAQRIAAQVL